MKFCRKIPRIPKDTQEATFCFEVTIMDDLTGRYTEYRRKISIVETKSIKDQ